MKAKIFLPLLFFISILSNEALAHCPLCTAGAAVAAGGAMWLGVSQIVIGLFIGAFAISIGWWVSKLIKKKYIPFQKTLIILFSFATTVPPFLAFMKDFSPLYVSLLGDYGSLLNRTYLVNMFLIGSIIGAIIVSSTPWLSSRMTKIRNNKMVPFQGIILTLSLLLIIGVLMQFLL